MKPSLLQLKHYRFFELYIMPMERYEVTESLEYPDLSNALFHAEIGYSELDHKEDEGAPEFALKIYLTIDPKQDAEFPYTIKIGVEGFFSLLDTPSDIKSFVVVNGSSLLYGVARDTLLATTLRFNYGPVMLPTVQFTELIGEQGDSVSNSAENH